MNNRDVLQKYSVHLSVKHRKKYTKRQYFRIAKTFIECIGKPVEQLERFDVDKYIASFNSSSLKHNTIVDYIVCLNVFFRYINRDDLKVKKPVYQKTHRNTISVDDITRIRNKAKEFGAEDYLITLCITDLDCRPSDITELRFSWIRSNKIYFCDTKTGDNYGYLTQEWMYAFEQYKKIRPTPNKGYEDYIFICGYGQHKGCKYTRNAWKIRNVIKNLAYKCDIDTKLTPYDLRASVITEEFNHYINPKIIQRKARHRNIQTTLKYNHVDDKLVEEYISTGTIFSDDNQRLFKLKRKEAQISDNIYKPCLPKDLNKTLGELDCDGASFSFSFSFDFVKGLSLVDFCFPKQFSLNLCDSILGMVT